MKSWKHANSGVDNNCSLIAYWYIYLEVQHHHENIWEVSKGIIMKSDQSVAVLAFILVLVIAINQINSVDSNCYVTI